MKYNFIKILIHFFIASFLTIATQLGGIIYLFSIFLFQKRKKGYRLKRILIFLVTYSTVSFLIIPKIAPYFGRIKLEDNQNIQAHNLLTKICNRNYVTPKLNTVLSEVSKDLAKEFPNTKLIYLDANFPFLNGFPLLPHLSHNDGKKIDLSFIYEDQNKTLTNIKPSNSGYGIFVEPLKNERNQIYICKQKNYWQYDFTKYLTFGSPKTSLKLSEKATKQLLKIITQKEEVSKVFIELHLKKRLKLSNSKIIFQGCQAVRHDDHIHFQIR